MTTHYDQTPPPGPSAWGPPTGLSSTAVQEPVAPEAPPAPESGEPKQPFVRRLWRGRPEDPRWVRPAFLLTLLVIGGLYTWNLTASGYANSFYSAAVQAGSQSWKALFFGSLDAANAITVDKPPASLWPMALSVRLLGLNSFAILFPQVLMAVATAAVLYAAVRRRFGAAAGFITMAVFALTPVAALMFRFNNPDAALALLMAAAVCCTLRALEKAQTNWLMWAGVAIGLAFLVKTLQAFLILPVLALVYVVLAPTSLKKRIGQVLLAGLAMVVAGGWWVAIVELWPASSRPYIGGSQNNSFLELTFGYNGLGRILGETAGPGGRGGGFGGQPGAGRLFNDIIGGQISWLIPAALILLAAAVWALRKLKRTDTTRAAFLLWGGSLLITMVVFSFMQGIFHEYYTVALAPYIAPLIGMGSALLWKERDRVWASLTLAGAMTATAVWGYVLLNRSSDYLPWLKWLVLVGGLVAALGLIFVNKLGRQLAMAVVGLSFVTALAGPTAYTLTTLNEGHTGSIVTAGPAVAGGRGGPGGGGGMGGGPGGGGFPGGGQNQQGQNQQNGNGNTQGQNQQGNGLPGGGMPGQNQQNGNGSTQGQGQNQQGGPGGQTGDGGGMAGGGGVGGLLNGASVSSEAMKLLETDAADYTWAAAAIGAQNAASYQLSTGEPVMAIGGFNGTDPSPTLAQFKEYVAQGKIHYFISSGSGGGMGGSSDGTSSQITSWVESTFKKVTVGTSTFYDLTQKASS